MIKPLRILLISSVVAAIMISGVIPRSVQVSYGVHESEELTWQLVFLSSYSACPNYHYQMTTQYNEIVIGYFEIYQLENNPFTPLCMPEQKYSTGYEIPEGLDLLILVYDRNLGRAELHHNGVGGLYHHAGEDWTKNHVIIFCDCSNFEYSEPIWILTHELSHFILFYKGFDKSIVEDHIHELDVKHDYCFEDGLAAAESCNSVKTKLKLEQWAYDWSVMKPYEPAIGQSIVTNFNQKNDSDLGNNNELRKTITKWWVSGKINNEYFLKNMKLLTEEQHMLEENVDRFFQFSGTKTFTDPPKDEKRDWINYNEEPRLTDEKLALILKKVPFIEKSQN